jgi:hypothetical protein
LKIRSLGEAWSSRFLDMEKVAGSNPAGTTISKGHGLIETLRAYINLCPELPHSVTAAYLTLNQLVFVRIEVGQLF